MNLRDRVEAARRGPWIPPPPPLALDTPLIMPDLATLERVAAGLKQPKAPSWATSRPLSEARATVG